MYKDIAANKRKSALLITTFCLVVIGLSVVFAYAMSGRSAAAYYIIPAAVVFSALMSFGSYWWSDKLALAVSGAHLVKREQELRLYRVVENLCIASGMPMPKIYVMEEPAMNAFATGRNPKNAALAVTRGLLNNMTNVELEGVVAHELSHIKNYDILVSTLVVVLVGAVAMMADLFIRFNLFGGRRSNDREGGNQLQAIMMIVGLVLAILSPIIAQLIQLAVSRKREFLADASGALLTRYPEGLASALEKISKDGNSFTHANKATAHLFFANPLGRRAQATGANDEEEESSSGGGFLAGLFNTHPPIEERIKRLRNMIEK